MCAVKQARRKTVQQTNRSIAKQEKKSRRLGERFVCQLLKSICKPKSAGIPLFSSRSTWRKRSPDYWLRCPVKFFMCTHKANKIYHKTIFFGWCDSLASGHVTSKTRQLNTTRINFIRNKNIFQQHQPIAWMHVNEIFTFISISLCNWIVDTVALVYFCMKMEYNLFTEIHLYIKTYRIQIDIATEWVHVQNETIIHQIDGEPNAWKTNGNQT